MRPFAASFILVLAVLSAPVVHAQSWDGNPYGPMGYGFSAPFPAFGLSPLAQTNAILDLEWAIDSAMLQQRLDSQAQYSTWPQAPTTDLRMARSALKQEATRLAKEALRAQGLHYPEHFSLLKAVIAKRKREDAGAFAEWTETTTPTQQFAELAEDVRLIVCLGQVWTGCAPRP